MAPLALTDREPDARRWLGALEAAHIPAELRIEDARRRSAALPLPVGPVFAATLYVAADHRVEAAKVLIDLGWDGRQVGGSLPTRQIPRGAVFAVASASLVSLTAVVVALLLRGI